MPPAMLPRQPCLGCVRPPHPSMPARQRRLSRVPRRRSDAPSGCRSDPTAATRSWTARTSRRTPRSARPPTRRRMSWRSLCVRAFARAATARRQPDPAGPSTARRTGRTGPPCPRAATSPVEADQRSAPAGPHTGGFTPAGVVVVPRQLPPLLDPEIASDQVPPQGLEP